MKEALLAGGTKYAAVRTYHVGTAVEIWNQKNRVSPKDLAEAFPAEKKANPKFLVDKFLGRPEGKLASDFKEADIGEPEIAAVRTLLEAEFEAAAANWKS